MAAARRAAAEAVGKLISQRAALDGLLAVGGSGGVGCHGCFGSGCLWLVWLLQRLEIKIPSQIPRENLPIFYSKSRRFCLVFARGIFC
eukprot:scaffold120331_cov54-Cyclotella_meneghiniana.AAC.2